MQASSTVTFQPLITTTFLAIGVYDDEINEEDEIFTATLSLTNTLNGVTLGDDRDATVSIMDDDGKPCVHGLFLFFS